jgi:hypothetical protein
VLKQIVAPTDAGPVAELPREIMLEQNFPNPFNGTTVIRFHLPSDAVIDLGVYTILGSRVAGLAQGMERAGSHEVRFDGSRFASGVYYLRLQAGGMNAVKPILLLR